MSSTKSILLERKKELQAKIRPLRTLEKELEEVEHLLSALDDKEKRHGREAPGHPPGCRCYPHCDPSR
jgi:hypothetical protein